MNLIRRMDRATFCGWVAEAGVTGGSYITPSIAEHRIFRTAVRFLTRHHSGLKSCADSSFDRSLRCRASLRISKWSTASRIPATSVKMLRSTSCSVSLRAAPSK
jgi:hypothetical protein